MARATQIFRPHPKRESESAYVQNVNTEIGRLDPTSRLYSVLEFSGSYLPILTLIRDN